jgi:hypothetical protein
MLFSGARCGWPGVFSSSIIGTVQLSIEKPGGRKNMEITQDTRVSDILAEYGDIAEVMEVFGVKRVGPFSVRRILTQVLTVKRAAFVHGVPVDDFLGKLREAVQSKDSDRLRKSTTSSTGTGEKTP